MRFTLQSSLAAQSAMFIVIAVLGFGMIKTSFADLHASQDPDKALLFDAHHPRALVNAVTEALTGSKSFDAPLALDRLTAALSRDPFTPFGFSVLALALQKTGDEARAAKALHLAADLSWHDPVARDYRLRSALVQNDIETALDAIDASYRMAREISKDDLKLLIGALQSPKALDALADRLALDPPWRTRFLQLLTASEWPLASIVDLRSEIERQGSAYTPDEMKPLLARMMKEGRVLQAYVAWLKSLPEDKRPQGLGLYNSDFGFPVSGLPFDWTFEPVAGSDIKVTPLPNGAVLSVSFLGPRLTFKNVYQTLVLPEGFYLFTGEEAAKGLSHEHGLRWRLSCLNAAGQDLFKSDGLKGDVFWRGFETQFEVGPDCPFQRLVLEAPIRVALDRVILGTVSFRNLKIIKDDSAQP